MIDVLGCLLRDVIFRGLSRAIVLAGLSLSFLILVEVTSFRRLFNCSSEREFSISIFVCLGT